MASRGRGAHRKGEAWERRVAAYLTDHTGIPFERVKDGEDSDREKFPGDLKCRDGSTVPFVCECKAWRVCLDEIWLRSSRIVKALQQAEGDARASRSKYYLLAVNWRGKPLLVADDNDSVHYLSYMHGIRFWRCGYWWVRIPE